jgi:tetratricopeptide (TPR) repeat protein
MTEKQELAKGKPLEQSRGKHNFALITLVLAATYGTYMSALNFPFVFDDRFQIENNHYLSSWSYLKLYFTQDFWSQMPGATSNLYRPLFSVWLRLNYILWGGQPAGWHLTTLSLHILATALVYLLGYKLLRDGWTAWFAALLFGLHPVHVEAVAWISGVTEPLSACFVLAAFLCYMTAVADRSQYPVQWKVASLILFMLAMLAKETAAVLPLLIFLYEISLGRPSENGSESSMRVVLRRAAQRCVVFLIPLAGYLLVRRFVLTGLLHKYNTSSLHDSLLRLPWLFCSYVRELLWPAKLSPLYDSVNISRVTDRRAWIPMLIVLAGVCTFWILRRLPISRITLLLAGWFLITLSPALVSSFVARPSESFQDRYVYLPSVAFVIAVAAVLRWLFTASNAAGRFTVAAAIGLLPVVLMVASRTQIQYWRDDYMLFSRASAIAPHNELARLNFASECINRREYQRALQLAEGTILLDPASARAYDSAAWAAFYMKNYALAEQDWSAATRMAPNQERSWEYLGVVRFQLGNYTDALEAFNQAIALDPKHPNLHYSRGLALARLQDWAAAKHEFLEELEIKPDNQAALTASREAATHVSP